MLSLRKIAIIGGIGYLVIFFTGIYANFFVLENLKVPESIEGTFINFKENTALLKYAIIAFMAMVVFDLILTWVLYVLFKKTDENFSVLTATFRLVNVAIFGVALYHLTAIIDLVSLYDSNDSYAIQQLNYLLNAFNDTWLVGLVFFGAHLILLSRLILKSKAVFKLIPILLLIAGIGYIIDSMLQFLYDDYSKIQDVSALIVVLPGIVGELSLTFWLLLKAGKSKS